MTNEAGVHGQARRSQDAGPLKTQGIDLQYFSSDKRVHERRRPNPKGSNCSLFKWAVAAFLALRRWGVLKPTNK